MLLPGQMQQNIQTLETSHYSFWKISFIKADILIWLGKGQLPSTWSIQKSLPWKVKARSSSQLLQMRKEGPGSNTSKLLTTLDKKSKFLFPHG